MQTQPATPRAKNRPWPSLPLAFPLPLRVLLGARPHTGHMEQCRASVITEKRPPRCRIRLRILGPLASSSETRFHISGQRNGRLACRREPQHFKNSHARPRAPQASPGFFPLQKKTLARNAPVKPGLMPTLSAV